MRQYIVDTILYSELNLLIRGEQKTESQFYKLNTALLSRYINYLQYLVRKLIKYG